MEVLDALVVDDVLMQLGGGNLNSPGNIIVRWPDVKFEISCTISNHVTSNVNLLISRKLLIVRVDLVR